MSMEDPLDLMAEDESFDLPTVGQEIEFFFAPGMTCPIADCNVGGSFPNKTRYQRHWEERHILEAEKWECAHANCKTLVRRKSDMKTHLKYVHYEKDDKRIEEVLVKCLKKVVRSKGFIDPGFFIFKGRSEKSLVSSAPITSSTSCSVTTSSPKVSVTTTTSTSTTVVPSVQLVTNLLSYPQEEENVDFTVHIPAALNKPSSTVTAPAEPLPLSFEPVPMSGVTSSESVRIVSAESSSSSSSSSSGVKKTLSLLDYQAVPRSSKPELPVLPLFAKTTESSTQTSAMDVKEVHLPPIPQSQQELEDHLRFLCNCMDQFGRQRESAKLRLQQLRKDSQEGASLQREREQRRKLESENRELRRQLAEIKWRQQLFPGIQEE